MTRAWRIELEAARYHVLSRGNERCNLVVDDKDRNLFPDSDISDRDMLICLLRQSSGLTNLQMAEKFDLTHSAVSRRVGVFKDLPGKSTTLQKKFNRVKSLIKI